MEHPLLREAGGDSASWSGGGIAALIRGRLLGNSSRAVAGGAWRGGWIARAAADFGAWCGRDPPQAPDRSAWPNQGIGSGVAVAPLLGAVPSAKVL